MCGAVDYNPIYIWLPEDECFSPLDASLSVTGLCALHTHTHTHTHTHILSISKNLVTIRSTGHHRWKGQVTRRSLTRLSGLQCRLPSTNFYLTVFALLGQWILSLGRLIYTDTPPVCSKHLVLCLDSKIAAFTW